MIKMTNLKVIFCGLFFSLAALGQALDYHHDANNFRCVKYIKNYDADTIMVDVPEVHPIIGKNVSVHVMGIDALEIKSNFWESFRYRKFIFIHAVEESISYFKNLAHIISWIYLKIDYIIHSAQYVSCEIGY